MQELRVVSFLPSGTELACALGLEPCLAGVSHECDYPVAVRSKPVVVHSALPFETMGLAEIDRAVSERLARGESLYEVDTALLQRLAPTHILTQDLCQVCAPAGNEVARALAALPAKPEVVWMSPHSIADIHDDLRKLGAATGTLNRAGEIIAASEARIRALRQRVAQLSSQRRPVFCVEWTDPLFCCGHWVPELVELAGGFDPLGRKWSDSVRVTWEEVAAARPELVVVMPCGLGLSDSIREGEKLRERFGSNSPAIYAVDASYFSRPTLRVIDGAELLAHLLWPGDIPWKGPANAFHRIA